MIDWVSLWWNSLWILGAAVLLANLSYQRWQAQMNGVRWWVQLQTAASQQRSWLGLALITAGLAGTSPTWWEVAMWSGLTAVSLVYAYSAGRQTTNQEGAQTHGN